MAQQKLPYPKSVFFIVTNEFCERFSYYGMKAVLTLYLKNVLSFNEDDSTQIYHAFGMLCYFTPVFGAMIADSFLGKFKTIFYLSVVYALGNIVLSLAATPPLHIPQLTFSMLGLLLIAIGTGGIKPCVSAFGGDQFKLPQQAVQLASFFSIFYFSINAGSLISTFLTPIFRKASCFGDDCYALAFSVPAALMIVALCIFLIGKPFYKISPPEGNVVVRVVKCIAHALGTSWSSSGEKKGHWLDYAEDKFDRKLIHDVKVVLRIFVLYLPLPVFWALFDQQGSRWTFQATRMDGQLFGNYSILPDQMQIVNPLLILLLIPIFDQGIYPCLGKMGILKKPLQRLTIGGLLAAAAFVISGFLELKLETTYPTVLLPNQSSLHFINQVPCTLRLDVQHMETNGTSVSMQQQLSPNENHIFKSIQSADYTVTLNVVSNHHLSNSTFNCEALPALTNYKVTARSEKTISLLASLNSADSRMQLTKPDSEDVTTKSEKGHAHIRFIYADLDANVEQVILSDDKTSLAFNVTGIDADGAGTITKEVAPDSYKVTLTFLDNTNVTVGDIQLRLGGNYVVALQNNKNSSSSNYTLNSYILVEPNSIHMLWLLPQYIVITVAEVMFSVTGLEFSYSQAPESMKSVIQAAWLLTVAFGNLIVLIIASAKLFDRQWKEFFLFAGLMLLDMFVFIVLAYFYKPAEKKPEDEDENHEMKSKYAAERENNSPAIESYRSP